MDNVMIAFEVIHHMKRKSKGKVSNVALKVDISKAYDRLNMGCLRGILLKLGFASKWVDMMMICVPSITYTEIVNEDVSDPIYPKLGLKQGDLLSPYLYILCAEGLSSLIERAELTGAIHGVKLCIGALMVTYYFVDDSYFFFKDPANECMAMKEIIQIYERGLGQAINCGKSGVFCSTNFSA